MWNTGSNNIGNGLDVGINVLDGEDHHYAMTISKHSTNTWKSIILPWCVDDKEVKKKAFHVTNIANGNLFLYLFQDYHKNKICWSTDLEKPWEKRFYLRNGYNSDNEQKPLPTIDIMILPDRVVTLPAENKNTVFKDTFDEIISVASAAGTIASVAVA